MLEQSVIGQLTSWAAVSLVSQHSPSERIEHAHRLAPKQHCYLHRSLRIEHEGVLLLSEVQ
jgi:hypothetical protein